MTSDAELTYFKMNMLQAEIAMNSMIAENRVREARGVSPVYGEADFLALIDEYGIHHDKFPFNAGV